METTVCPPLAYIEGFVVGEGCISVYENGRKSSHTLVVQVVQNKSLESESLLNSMQGRFGGKVSKYPSRGAREKFNWLIQGESAAALLEAILPDLILKREQTQLAVDWYRARPKQTRNERGWHEPKTKKQQRNDRKDEQRLRQLKKI